MRPDKSISRQPRTKFNIRKGDMVIVLAGDDKGKKGRVVEMITKKMRVLVEGVNIVSRHTKPDAKTPNGGIVKKEASIHLSNVALIDPKSGKATRVRRKRQDRKVIRIATKSGQEIK